MRLETFFNNFELLADAPNGVQKLRELILQLAVRGKLVPQDPTDEPASVLIEKIRAEKEWLITEGKIKKTEPLPVIEADEIPFELPEGWEWVRLDFICHQITDGTHHTPTYTVTGVPFLSVKDISSGKIDLNNTKYISKEEHKKLIKRCNPEFEDVLLTKVGTTGIAKVIDINVEFSVFVSLALLKFSKHLLSPYYIELVINSPLVKEQSRKNTQGIGNKNLVLKYIKNFILPIPPAVEQKSIVAKVDQLIALCDELEARQQKRRESCVRLNNAAIDQLLTTREPDDFSKHWQSICDNFDLLYSAPENIGKLRQAILQLAVQGKLVKQDPNDEPASVLLEKIMAEKEWLTKEKKIKKSEPLPPIEADEVPYKLPKGWQWTRFPELGEFGRGKSKHRPRNDPALYREGTYPLVQTGDVARANGIINTYTGLYNENGLAQSRLWSKGTLCITIAANIADAALLGFDACFPDSIVGFIPSTEIGQANYFGYFMRTAKEHLQDYAPSTAQKNINLGILEKLLIPLPPKDELQRIVAKVNQLMALCDELEAKLTQSQTDSEKLINAAVRQVLGM